jgi:hypothetical protein
MRSARVWRYSLVLLCLGVTPAYAQSAASAAPSNLWLAAGAGFAALRGDCQTCEEDYPYRRSTSVLVNGGYRVHARMDVGAEVFWMPVTTVAGDRIRTTHLDAVAQFRPWASKGFSSRAVRAWHSCATGSTCRPPRP